MIKKTPECATKKKMMDVRKEKKKNNAILMRDEKTAAFLRMMDVSRLRSYTG